MLLLNTLQEVQTIQTVLRMLANSYESFAMGVHEELVLMSFQWCKKNKTVYKYIDKMMVY